MKIVSIVGARPQFIKAAVVSEQFKNKGINEVLVHTGQHYDFNMSEIFFEELGIYKPQYNLGVGSGPQGEQTAKMLVGIEKILMKEKPDFVVVYGDTNSTLAGALAAVKLHIPVAHVEAGLRSFNKSMPEEINRVLTDHSSDLLFAPTDTAVENLANEGISRNVYNVGDVMFDIALKVSENVDDYKVLRKYKLLPKNYILTTIHRASNTDSKENLENIFKALKKLSESYKIFFPVHPRTQKALSLYGISKTVYSENLVLSEPVSYKEMLALERNAKMVITDSGGVQKEAYFFKVPCVVVRGETEWIELVNSGWNFLSGVNTDDIIKTTSYVINRKEWPVWKPFFGKGDSSKKIVEVIVKNAEL